MIDAPQLTDEQAISAANFVVYEWIKVTGPKVFALSQTIEEVRQTHAPIEAWVADPKSADPEVAKLCRRMLDAFLNSPQGQEQDFRGWARKGIDKARQAQAQVFDPATTLMLLTGLVLAARLKRIGPHGAEFFEGLPTNLSKVLDSVSSMATFS